ncbi:MAG TPA: hypothetical protein VJ991_06760 [Balneolales bacterium]|nr:hypothetical protein [Balneolales bacterium]
MKKSYFIFASISLFVLGTCLFAVNSAKAQSSTSGGQVFSPGETNFAMLGEFSYGMNVTKHNTSFVEPDLGIMPLYRQGNFFFEAGIGASFSPDGPELGVGPINVSYMLPNGWLVRAGHFDALPFGRFPRTYDPGWINPMATGPAGFDDIGGYDDFGVQLQGSGYLGNMRLRTFISVTNGPMISTDQGSVGMLTSGSVYDNNKAKMFGGRMSLSPFQNSNFSVGLSEYYTGNVGDPGTQYKGLASNIFAVDFNWAPTVTSLNGFLRLRGQINDVHVDNSTNNGTVLGFKDNSSASYGLLAYQPSMSSNPILQKLMFGFMYSHVNTPSQANWDLASTSQYDMGITYWFNWRTNFKIDYDIQENTTNALMLQFAMQL